MLYKFMDSLKKLTKLLEDGSSRKMVFICCGCGQKIKEGDSYIDVLGEQFCVDCAMKSIKLAVKEDDSY